MKKLSQTLIDGLSNLLGVKVYGTLDSERSVVIVTFTVTKRNVSEIGLRLDEEYAIGSFPEGTVRLAPGVFTTMSNIQEAI
ncbi:hypothetical protein ACFLTP_00015 [Chloroflexota bacterium]